jgi:hypothetical protein
MLFEQRFGAREVKFLVSPDRAEQVRIWARSRLAPDPNAGCGGDTYRVTSLYFDTACFDVFHAHGSYGRAKYRVRRYDDALTVFVERKMRTESLVSKRRALIGLDEIPGVGGWFRRRLDARRLQPVCSITYLRTALIGRQGERLTIDDQLFSDRVDAFTMGEPSRGIRIAAAHQILELKYLGEMPALFKELLETFPLHRTAVSKYRTAAAELGLAAKHA